MAAVQAESIGKCGAQPEGAGPGEPYRKTVEEVVAALSTDTDSGLFANEAGARLVRYGRNALRREPPEPAWHKFLAQFTDTLVLLLLVAGLVSAALWLYERDAALPYEAIAIFAIVLLNAVMSFAQQARAERALAALRQMSAARASVIRGGSRRLVPASELVPGDIILIEEGDTVPADARLIRCTGLQTSEAALTGESLPVTKDPAAIADAAGPADRRNMVFSGTIVTYGRALAIVTATGMNTELGRIAGMLKQTPAEETPLQRELRRVGRLLGQIVVVIALVMIGTVLLFTDVRGVSAYVDVLVLGVALAVAAVPEGLPAVVTAVLAIGVQRMARRNAIIRHLAAVEALGSADVIASDKTGTLTRNEMTVRAVVTASGGVCFSGTGYQPDGALRRDGGGEVDAPLQAELNWALIAADRASNAVLQRLDAGWTIHGDPTEGALVVAARKAGLRAEMLDSRFVRLNELPFSSERRLMTTLHRDTAEPPMLVAFSKGAPDVVLARSSHELVGTGQRILTDARRAEIVAENERRTGQALRTLGVAFRRLAPEAAAEPLGPDLEQDLVFLGLVGMLDPPRDEARQAVARAKSAGIRPIMITGDHPRTAAVIAADLGIGAEPRAVTGAEIEAMTSQHLERTLRDASVYARVSPEHKLRIVQALQRNRLTVAMTGDGVNDAPALKTADIGIAMGRTGTDVSKEAADMVLADDNFATIVAAVEEGRAIFANIRKFLRYLLSSNIGEVMTMFFGVMLVDAMGLTQAAGGGVVLPLLATQILWINLVTDGAPALALGVDPAHAGVMTRPPRPRGEGVITARMWAGIGFVGAIMAAGTLLVLDGALPGGLIEGSGSIRYGQTMAFTTLVLFQLFNVFNARSDERSAFDGLFSNSWLWAAVGVSAVLQVCAIYAPFLQEAFSTVPLSATDWLLCAAVASSVLWLREATKLIARLRSHDRTASRAAHGV